MTVKSTCDLIESGTARAVDPRARVALALRQPDLPGEQELTAADDAVTVEQPLGVVDVISAVGGVDGVDVSGGEPETRRSDVEHVGAVGAGATLAVLSQVGADLELLALRHALAPPAPTEVEELTRCGRRRVRQDEAIERVRLGTGVRQRRSGSDEPRRQERNVQLQRQLRLVVDSRDLELARAGCTSRRSTQIRPTSARSS